ncbi:hypothetical protein AJ79_01679 [Helicocarpus griseus UAMH5409]|uniref:Uncharacterized protein n=1 Tax=Helicocarpus griseus UAMH5409 TaxID=1447875 RepID=A0A2B7Y6B1_9EURO|nr:hypothetical protein AJ79_01679 [Helicocarpus griseus UAMH5409]
MPAKNSPARLADKRPLAVDDAKTHKISPEQSRTKRRRIGRNSTGNEKVDVPTPTKQSIAAGEQKQKNTPTIESGKKEKHGRKENASQPDDTALAVVNGVSASQSTPITKRQKGKTSEDVQSSNKSDKSSQWAVSRAAGGRFSDIDTIVTPDEKHFILFSNTSARIFSVATSSSVRTLEIRQDMKRITSCKPSAVDADHLYMSTLTGSILKWNWVTGEQVETWDAARRTFAIDVCAVSKSQDSPDEDIVFTMSGAGSGKTEVSMHVKGETGSWESRVIREISTPVNELKVAADGKVIIVIADERLFVGYTAKLRLDSLDTIKYTWLEVRLPISVTCSDVRERALPAQPSKSSAPTSKIVDLVLGERGGAILIYHDILNSLLRSENKSETGSDLVTNRLHWHRSAVKTVKWSRDGNYIISGGSESVIVLYQLDTGRKQFLPHLASHVCSVVVSPTGKLYAVRLGDNSAMILSTSDLRPIASVSGLHLPSEADDAERKPSQATKKNKSAVEKSSILPALLHPIQSEHLLAAVSLAPARFQDTPTSASSLQTFNVLTSQHVSRQALARTNVSVVNAGPQGLELTTPDVKHLGITPDGEWLSTVDEWMQYPQDVTVLHPTSIAPGMVKREIFLKFWRWNESTKEWELSTRIDAPHFNTSLGSTRVLDLAASPAGSAFATVGEDAVVRVWSPNARYRSGQIVKDNHDEALQNWRPIRSIQLEKFALGSESVTSKAATLTFSDDGSVLAACWTGQNGSRLIYLINPKTGEICHARDNLYMGAPRGVRFLDRYMVILSDQLVVWDTVADSVRLVMLMEDDTTYSLKNQPKILTVNRKSQTFAVAFTYFKRKAAVKPKEQQRKPRHQLTVFDIKSLRPLLQANPDHACRALLPDLRSGEYVLIDAAAQIQRIGSGEMRQLAPQITVDAASSSLVQTGLENIFGAHGSLGRTLPGAGSALPATRQIAHGQNAASNEAGNLTDIFDLGPSFVLPGVDALFEDVVKHFNANAVPV